MTATDHAPVEESTDPGAGWLQEDMPYIKTALWLGFFTAIEVFTYFESVHQMPEWALILSLCVLMVVKFYLVVSVFMHLKDDNDIFTKMLVAGLCIAWPVYCIFAFAMGWLDWEWYVKVAVAAIPTIITGWAFGYMFQNDGSDAH